MIRPIHLHFHNGFFSILPIFCQQRDFSVLSKAPSRYRSTYLLCSLFRTNIPTFRILLSQKLQRINRRDLLPAVGSSSGLSPSTTPLLTTAKLILTQRFRQANRLAEPRQFSPYLFRQSSLALYYPVLV